MARFLRYSKGECKVAGNEAMPATGPSQPSGRAIVGVPAWPVGDAGSRLGRSSATVCGLRMALLTAASPSFALHFTGAWHNHGRFTIRSLDDIFNRSIRARDTGKQTEVFQEWLAS